MKLEKGNFVRTKAGMIAKIISKYNVSSSLHRDEIVFILDNGNKLALHSRKVIKASNNIIDLIEEGDYVNGYLIEKFYDTYNPKTEEYEDILGIAIYDDARMDCIEEIRPLRTLDIKSIVTKEMFESVQYKVD